MAEASDEPVYYISVAARLVDCHPQTLRTYERMGLVEPARNERNVRLYSDSDIERITQIQRLTQEMGVNLAGVDVVLKLMDQIERLREKVQRLEEHIERGPRRLPAGQSVRVEIQTDDGGPQDED